MLDDLDKKIINKIEREKIKPFSRSFFVIKKIFFWIFISVFMFFSALSLSIMALIIKHGDWDIYQLLGLSPAFFMVKAFPYFWFLGVIIFLILVLFKTKKADGTYNYPLFFRAIIGFLIIVVLAVVLYFSGLSRNTENYLSKNRMYIRFNYLRSSWQNPEKGLIAGTLKLQNDKLILEDFSDESWILLQPEGNFLGQELLLAGERVKIIGQVQDGEEGQKYFLIQELRSWKCGCSHCAKMKGECSACSNGNSCQQERACGLPEH